VLLHWADNSLDADHDGSVTFNEFRHAISALGIASLPSSTEPKEITLGWEQRVRQKLWCENTKHLTSQWNLHGARHPPKL